MNRLFFLLLPVLIAVGGNARADSTLPAANPIPGGIAIINIPPEMQRLTWRYRDRPVWTLKKGKQQLAIVGIPLSQKTGTARLQATDGQSLSFQVHPHHYEESRIYLEDQSYVTPDQPALVRIRLESQEIKKQFAVHSRKRPALPFALPLQGDWSSRFGLRRFFNDQPRRPHSGLDIAAPEGSSVQAPARGRVLVTGDYYFNGKTVFLDHGKGLISMYCHLHSIAVKAGQRVSKGRLIGTVGKTGRVTAAHLHWSVNLGGAMVDPVLFLAQAK